MVLKITPGSTSFVEAFTGIPSMNNVVPSIRKNFLPPVKMVTAFVQVTPDDPHGIFSTFTTNKLFILQYQIKFVQFLMMERILENNDPISEILFAYLSRTSVYVHAPLKMKLYPSKVL